MAVPQLIDALRLLDQDPDTDVIVIARGGGSVEDLLAFSDRGVVPGGGRRPAQRLVGERQQILHAATASGNHDDVGVRILIGPPAARRSTVARPARPE